MLFLAWVGATNNAILLQKDSDVIKIDIQCLVKGDVVLECVHLDLEPEREVMMFRIMFNTAFIRSNILMLNSDNLDIMWDSKVRYPKGFRAEVNILQLARAEYLMELSLLTLANGHTSHYNVILLKFRFCLARLTASLP